MHKKRVVTFNEKSITIMENDDDLPEYDEKKANNKSMSDSNEPTITIQGATPPSKINNRQQGIIDTPITIPSHRASTTATPTSIIISTEPKRRVSIASDPVTEHNRNVAAAAAGGGGGAGYDNLAFEQNPRRKVSQSSLHSHHGEVGPVRRKSILVNSGHDNESVYSHGSTHSHETKQNGGKIVGPTALDALHARLNEQQQQNTLPQHNIEQSWIYGLCMRCRIEDNQPAWEPPHWQKVCPYPLCPTFRQFARIISLILIGVLIWITTYVIIGDTAGPGGQLFGLVVLTVASHIGGFLMSLTTLPRLIGMLFVGIIFQNVGWVDLSGDFGFVTAELRKFALTLILIRAGLEMEPEAFKKVYKTILKLGIIPWAVECSVMAVMSHYLLGLPWIWGFLLGSIIAAVSPAVVVPCLFRLRTKGYGVAKGIPTLVIAVAGIDDALSVAIFGIISTIMFSANDLTYQISQAPVCIIGGLAFGVIWGCLARYIPEKGDPYVVPLRTIMLFAGGLLAIFGSEMIGYEGAGPLGVVFAAFVSNYFWCQEGWNVDDNPVSTAFEIFWMIFEPILFGITGTTVKINELDPDLVGVGFGCIAAGAILRILCTACIAFGDRLNLKEKFFVGLSWMAKATVQAALGPVAMRHLTSESSDDERRYAKIVQTIAVLSIVLTAPLGAILISISGTKLLTKTKQPQIVEGWRRSHRPSMRDISIIDEEEEREDPELPDNKLITNNANLQIPTTFTHNK